MLATLALCAQSSLLAAPLYLDEHPPESRAMRAILLVHSEATGVSATVRRSREEAQALADALRRRLDEGADFSSLAREHSAHRSASLGGELGCFPPGLLQGHLEEFLASAEVGQISDVIEMPNGLHIVQRVDAVVGCRHILVGGTDGEARDRCAALRARIEDEGDAFAELARAHSEDAVSAARGGDLAIFHRSASNRLLKKAAFDAAPGELVGPLRTPLGWHLVQRVAPETIDPALEERAWIRARVILLNYAGAQGAGPEVERLNSAAEALAQELRERILGGEDMGALASVHSNDPGTAEGGGDLGWLRRNSPQNRAFLDRAFLLGVDEVSEPFVTTLGWVVVRREG